jgi:Mrp family chromosome partitioning ATPase
LAKATRWPHAIITTAAPARASGTQLTVQAQQLATDLLLDPRQGGRILGITSPLGGEGKSLLAALIALSLARASRKRTVLIESTWQRPTLSALFDLPTGPGLAEWLRSECDEASIRHEVGERLVVIPAGNAGAEELLLLERLQDIGIAALAGPDDFVVVDLPSALPSAAGRLAANLVERIVVVARAGATPLPAIADTCDQLGHLAIQGVVLNQVERRIPHWLDRIL